MVSEVATRRQGKEADPWNLPPRSSPCYSTSSPVFTAPTYQTFVLIVTGWILSQRHRYITEVIFSGGNVGDRPLVAASIASSAMPPGTSIPSPCAWPSSVVTILAPGATLLWAVDDTLCRKRGLTLYGAGMHYDPLISSRAKPLVSWGHDWVVLCLIIVHPFWAPTKVFALPIAMRLYRNRQGLTKGKKGQKAGRRPPSPSPIPTIAPGRNWPWN